MIADQQQPVLILGAGINGAALARELVLNRVPVWIVDTADVAGGATARASRLIHGGLRYLEYGDVRLVRESLAERSRLRHLAPQYVEPLRLFIPVSHRLTGFFQSAYRFLGASRSRWFRWLAAPFHSTSRGLWVVRMGLWMYDRLVRDPEFAPSHVRRVSDPSVPHVDPRRFRWLCAYSDAQMVYPERFVVALLEDARQLAAESGIEFRVLTYHRAELHGATVRLHGERDETEPLTLHPAAIVNATGAWGDLTLGSLHVPSRRLFGGTKGSHFVTHQPRLREALGDSGLYAEASDGRLIFVLPFGAGVLVGTTDERFDRPPDQAVASELELRYLLDMVNELFPQVGLTEADIDMHYSGVRPLPYSAGGTTGSISREHHIEVHPDSPVPFFTLVGGKLTTCRAFAESAADLVLQRLDRPRIADSRARPIPGGRDYPATRAVLEREWDRIAARFQIPRAQVEALWTLLGNRAEDVLADAGPLGTDVLDGTAIPVAVVRWMIRHEWVTTVGDLVERRLMLLFQPGPSPHCQRQLAGCLVDAGRLAATAVDAAVAECAVRLERTYGKRVDLRPATPRIADDVA